MPKAPPDNAEDIDRTVEIGTVVPVQPLGLKAGDVLEARYQIEATLGEGGSGQVFRAWDRVLGEPIALKVLRPDPAREKSWLKRLGREVRVARAIRHPNVCRVFDLSNAGQLWFVSMELASGGTLRDTLHSEQARSLAERLNDARAICAGLAAIHLVGITHRDVTPRNVLRMGDGRLVISDFGLAVEGGEMTVQGGTPRYMAPETAMGQRADQRSDVWQLGFILHELLFDKRPDWQRTGKGMVLRPPVEPVASAFEQELARLCRDCLAQNPEDRPANAMAVSARLATAEVAESQGPLGRLLAAPRRRGTLAGAAVLLALGVGGLTLRHELRRPAAATARPAALDDADRRLLRSMAETLRAEGRPDDARRLNRLAGAGERP